MTANFFMLAESPSIYYTFENSDALGKAIVIILVLGSIITWSIMLDKAISVHRANAGSLRFFNRFRGSQRVLGSASMVQEAANDPSPAAKVCSEGLKKLVEFYEQDAPKSYNAVVVARPTKLSEAQYNAIEAVLEREVSSQIMELEERIPILGTLVSVSPFLGLFGTVWGVMLAFAGIAIAGKPDFNAMAPGIAGALLTTVAGLVVAIPSMVGYNLLNNSIRATTVYMDNFTEEFMAKLKLEQLGFERSNQPQRPENQQELL